MAKHGREPTFWLDVACINQDMISDGLKVLPINLMACRQVLVLVGPSYSQRLWCMWELYILSMFNNENVMDKVHVAEHAGAGVNLSKVLGLFSLRNAHCFDPNEEAKLRGVIEAGGEEDFCRSLRALGRQIGQQNKHNAALQDLTGSMQDEFKQLASRQTEMASRQTEMASRQTEMASRRQTEMASRQDAFESQMRGEMKEVRGMCAKILMLLDAKEKAI